MGSPWARSLGAGASAVRPARRRRAACRGAGRAARADAGAGAAAAAASSLAATAAAGLPPLARDVSLAAFAAVGARVWTKGFDALASREVLSQTLSRKLVHVTCGPMFVLIWPLFSAEPHARFVALAVPALQAVRLAALGSGAVRDEGAVRSISRGGAAEELLRGPLYYVIVMMLATLCWRESAAGLVALGLMCGGDGLADIVGRRLGASNKLPFNPDKSLAGSLAMFAGSVIFAGGLVLVFAQCGLIAVDTAAAAKAILVISAVAAVVESLPLNGMLDDNFSVPAVGFMLGALLL